MTLPALRTFSVWLNMLKTQEELSPSAFQTNVPLEGGGLHYLTFTIGFCRVHSAWYLLTLLADPSKEKKFLRNSLGWVSCHHSNQRAEADQRIQTFQVGLSNSTPAAILVTIPCSLMKPT